MEIPDNYIIAEGPEGLKKVLNELLEKTKNDPIFANEEHYILYQIGSQKSLIRVDTTEIPFKFIYYDFMGRPATAPVREALARFLWENCGEKERFLKMKGIDIKNIGE